MITISVEETVEVRKKESARFLMSMPMNPNEREQIELLYIRWQRKPSSGNPCPNIDARVPIGGKGVSRWVRREDKLEKFG